MYSLRVHDIYDGLVVRMTTVADPANHTDRHGGAGPLSSWVCNSRRVRGGDRALKQSAPGVGLRIRSRSGDGKPI